MKLSKHQQKTSNSMDTVVLFAAISVYLSSIEYLLPRPMPFFRFGLANIAILLVIRQFSFRDVLVVVLLKVLGLAILNGTLISYVFLFSLSGSLASFVVMKLCACLDEKKISLVGISICGAFASNVLQGICAIFFIFGMQAWIILPYVLSLGVISSVVVGVFAQYFYVQSQVLPSIFDQYKKQHTTLKNKSKIVEPDYLDSRTQGMQLVLLVCGIASGVAFALTDSLLARALQVLLFFVCAIRVKKIKILYFVCLIISISFFYMLIPTGKVLFTVASFAFTQGALYKGLFRSLTLCGYVFLSLWCIRSDLCIPGRVGRTFSTMLGYFYKLSNIKNQQKQKKAQSSSDGSQKINEKNLISYMDSFLLQVSKQSITDQQQQKSVPWVFVGISVVGVYSLYFLYG